MNGCLGIDVCVGGILLNEFTARFYVVAHEHREDFVGLGSILDCHLLQESCFRVHIGLPKLLRINFTHTFVALCV